MEEARCRPVSVVFENGVEKDSTGGEVLLPFNYRTRWVGYLGYEMRHLVDKSAEVPSPGAAEGGVPTAAFVFADSSIVVDFILWLWRNRRR